MQNVVEHLGVTGQDDSKADIFHLFEAWLRDERRRWLLILDNADDARFLREAPSTSGETTGSGHAPAPNPTRLDRIPVCGHRSILFTCRSKHAATQFVDESDMIIVPPMDEEHAITLLRKKLELQGNNDDITELARALEFMPLAIAQAAAYIMQRAPRCSMRRYLDELQKSDRSKTSLLNRDDGNLRRDKEASNSVLHTWQISFDHIHQVWPSAANLMSLMSIFDRQAIPESLLIEALCSTVRGHNPRAGRRFDSRKERDCSSEDGDSSPDLPPDHGFEDDLTMLRGYSFVSVTTDAATFEMHQLVQLATQRWLDGQGQLRRWQKQFIIGLDPAFPNGDYGNWAACRALFPYAKLASELRFREPSASLHWAAVMYRASWYAMPQGNFQDAERMARRSEKVRKEELGQQHKDTLSSMAMVAWSWRDQGQWTKAEELEVQVMETRKRVLGDEHPSTLTSMANLALTYRNQGRWGEIYAKPAVLLMYRYRYSRLWL